jgi:hypothetical protein
MISVLVSNVIPIPTAIYMQTSPSAEKANDVIVDVIPQILQDKVFVSPPVSCP